MPKDVSNFYARSRPYHDPDLGTMVVREPTMGDYRRAASDPWWWVACLSMVDGTPLLADPADMGRIRADIANRLWDVVQQPHPTEPPPGGSSESQAPSSAI